jgi:hypothetical protein
MSRLKKSLGVNLDQVRIREFDMAGQKFKVRVPLSGEADGIYERTKEPDQNLVEIKYKEISEPILANKEVLKSKDFVFTENDIVVKDQSMRQLAKNKAQTELRILETFKLLVTADGSSLENLTYEEIAEDFPLPVQLSMVKKITDVISPNYEETRKN